MDEKERKGETESDIDHNMVSKYIIVRQYCPAQLALEMVYKGDFSSR